MKVAIIGAGISGLVASHRLLSPNAMTPNGFSLDVTLFEASGRPGGIIKTIREDGLILEQGPDSFITVKPAALELCRQLGLESRLISTNPDPSFRRAFIAGRGALNAIPKGFSLIAPARFDTFFKSDILSRWGKLRMAIEQFIPRCHTDQEDESVSSFVRRRFGPEAAAKIAQPMLGGIYTGNVERLSARATLANFLQYEKEWGSVTQGLRRASQKHHPEMQGSGARYDAFLSLDDGLETLVDALVQAIGRHRIRCNTAVSCLSKNQDGSWNLLGSTGEMERFEAVIVALPAYGTAKLLGNVDARLADIFLSIRYASSAVVTCLYDRGQISHALDGFGFVVPGAEERSIIAGSFASVKFAGRCPQDQVLIRAFMGGDLQERLLELPSSELISLAAKDLSFYLGVTGAPLRSWITRWPTSMPQYEVGHLERVKALSNLLEKHQNLFYAGAAMNGVGLPDCIASGQSAADSLLNGIYSSCAETNQARHYIGNGRLDHEEQVSNAAVPL